MPDPMHLTCRCSWRGTFDASQKGLTVNCPECGRGFYVTDNPAEFKNRNVGEQDFRLDDVDLGEGAAVRGSQAGAATRGGKSAASESRATVVRPSRRKIRAVNQGYVATDRKHTLAVQRSDPNRRAMWIAIVVVAAVAVAGFIWYRQGLHGSQERQARATADLAVDCLKRTDRVAAGDIFESSAAMEALMQAFEGWRSTDPRIETRRRSEKFEYPDYHVAYRVLLQKTEYEIKLDLHCGTHDWQVTSGKSSEVPPAFRTQTRD